MTSTDVLRGRLKSSLSCNDYVELCCVPEEDAARGLLHQLSCPHWRHEKPGSLAASSEYNRLVQRKAVCVCVHFSVSLKLQLCLH